jgi:hypothetical protein
MADKVAQILWWIALASPLFSFAYAWKMKAESKIGRVALGIYITIFLFSLFGCASCLVSMKTMY